MFVVCNTHTCFTVEIQHDILKICLCYVNLYSSKRFRLPGFSLKQLQILCFCDSLNLVTTFGQGDQSYFCTQNWSDILTAVTFQWLRAELGQHVPNMYVSNEKSVVSSCLTIEVISGDVFACLTALVHSNFLGLYFPFIRRQGTVHLVLYTHTEQSLALDWNS